MTNLELALAVMEPGRDYTSAEIMREVWPDYHTRTEFQRNNLRGRITEALKTAAKYGIVERVGTTDTGGIVWRVPA